MDYAWILAAYLIGSIPFGLVVGKLFCNVDPREVGSKNIGTTNVARNCGTGFGVLVLACDLLKGLVPVAMAGMYVEPVWLLSLVAFAAVLGHVYPLYLGFKGGKAVATTIGIFIPLCFWPLFVSSMLCIAVIAASGFVSMGSLTLVTALPAILLVTGNIALLPLALAVMVLVYWRHRENILRLAKGEEKPWRKGKAEKGAA